jgi:3-phosphoshikimate 1-carboxyvinyltransferase
MVHRPHVAGVHRVPGDKSLTHRALLLGGLSGGRSRISGALTSFDARSTARVLRAMGVQVTPLRGGGDVLVTGPRALRRPAVRLHCGNSGTTARLLLGILAAQPWEAILTGDASLRRRPMRRVTDPLVAMGARVRDWGSDGLPLAIRGGSLRPLDWTLPVASAQIKSALLLAGVAGGVAVRLTEPGPSRDHTERLLGAFGFRIRREAHRLSLTPNGALHPFEFHVPGDPSSAAFLVAASLLAPGGAITIEGVGLNPTRIGFLEVIRRMGGKVTQSVDHQELGEPVGTITAGASSLRAVQVGPAEVPGVIDEIPVLACLAARAEGASVFRGLAELRVKESDRLGLLARNLRAIGVDAEVVGDDLQVTGTDAPLRGRVITGGDHRMAMAFGVLGTLAGSRLGIDDPACAGVSFPGFAAALAALFQAKG